MLLTAWGKEKGNPGRGKISFTCPTREEWVRKIWYIFVMKCFSAINKSEVTFAGNWTQLETIILSSGSLVFVFFSSVGPILDRYIKPYIYC